MREISTVALDADATKFVITSDRDKSSDTYKVEDFQAKGERRRLTLTGTGYENDAPVEVRITLTIDRNFYQFEKETRPAGKEFKFRDGYTFTRRLPPS